MSEFQIKDSGARQEFSGGMVRDTTEGKVDWLNILFGPMARRWAEHMTKGRQKYPDPAPGVPNWTLAVGEEELYRARASALRHMMQWLSGDRDEDHAAAIYFNVNLAEYVLDKMADAEQPDVHDDPSWGPENAARFGLDVILDNRGKRSFVRTGERRLPKQDEYYIGSDGTAVRAAMTHGPFELDQEMLREIT